MQKRIAIIGSGISGLVSAYLLSQHYDVTLFEANDYLGGHTHTVPVQFGNETYHIDTGFIVFNKKTYPLFCQLLRKLNVPIQMSEMSFSYRANHKDFEYNGHNLNTMFADRRNLIQPRFYLFLSEILRFNKAAKRFLSDAKSVNITIQEFITDQHFSESFVDYYLIPMMASIWSKKKEDTLNCSAHFIFQFYANHGLLNVNDRPDWYVIQNGSQSYIPALTSKFNNQIHLNTKIEKIEREANLIKLSTNTSQQYYDAVVIATHSDQALTLLKDPTQEEQEILSAITYCDNEVILHTDKRVMPKRRLAWASWNYFDNKQSAPTLTYYMNRLQNIKSDQDFFVSVNLSDLIDTDKIIDTFHYAHPCLTQKAVLAQQRLPLINGMNNTYYVGSYWGYGFHEDGVKSAVTTCALLGASL